MAFNRPNDSCNAAYAVAEPPLTVEQRGSRTLIKNVPLLTTTRETYELLFNEPASLHYAQMIDVEACDRMFRFWESGQPVPAPVKKELADHIAGIRY